ncbi:MAG: phosphoglucosamine mutase [Acidobacteria bacterium RIFCSPLOWO2_02_FULL_61_28]|nr:MAG: phosphoglucosamine mutase [Acidobacteria bacterium RIFCSPLOWO2_02_FULL_61_28]
MAHSHEKELFGTDGIRGVAGEPPLDSDTVFAVGFCLGQSLPPKASARCVILGEDTRESSRWIAETVAAGLQEAGIEVVSAGVITTPGLAFLTASAGCAAGVMISASHNLYRDNGIKVFASTGFKLPDEDERAITREIYRVLGSAAGPRPSRFPLQPDPAWVRRYVEFLRRAAGSSWSLPSGRLIVDCANGSASGIARDVFAGYGLEVQTVADQPNGRNINWHCGSLHLESLQQAVLLAKASLGVALDGDADRALLVAGNGQIVNGDGILWAASRSMRGRGTLTGGAVVGTVMSNLGLELALEREGLKLLRTPVGDKYVLEEMRRSGVNLGGEPSGHIIFRDLATTGDGLLTALQMLRLLAEHHGSLEQLVDGLEVFPQTILNVRVRERPPLESLPRVQEQIAAGQKRLGASGRVLVRYSGTEPLARVMVEAASAAEVERVAAAIAHSLEESLGSG